MYGLAMVWVDNGEVFDWCNDYRRFNSLGLALACFDSFKGHGTSAWNWAIVNQVTGEIIKVLD